MPSAGCPCSRCRPSDARGCWASSFIVALPGQPRQPRRADHFAHSCRRLRKLTTALELGCSRGHAVAALATKGISATGVDLSPVQIDGARQQWGHLPNAYYVQADVLTFLAEAGQRWDAIYPSSARSGSPTPSSGCRWCTSAWPPAGGWRSRAP
ncbi:class I SAM-dependent methyltransferase, partial [Nonomuraea candida]|uniref:class I SAM-dependent methyltransferase n=1 Tax=Nonomuraea candida TaxID=359159 RepID=UPI001FDF980A